MLYNPLNMTQMDGFSNDGIFSFGLSWYWPVGAKRLTANAH